MTLQEVHEAIRSAGLNQKQLAAACGCSAPTISTNLRGGKRRPDAQIVMAMANKLGLTFDDVYGALTRREMT